LLKQGNADRNLTGQHTIERNEILSKLSTFMIFLQEYREVFFDLKVSKLFHRVLFILVDYMYVLLRIDVLYVGWGNIYVNYCQVHVAVIIAKQMTAVT
jgi:hypothetical protein